MAYYGNIKKAHVIKGKNERKDPCAFYSIIFA